MIQTIEQKRKQKEVAVCFRGIAIWIVIITVFLVIFARLNIQEYILRFKITAEPDWNSKVVVGFALSETDPVEQGFQLVPWSGSFLGTQEGCECQEWYFSPVRKIFSVPCQQLTSMKERKPISGIPKTTLTAWASPTDKIFAKVSSNTTFKSLLSNRDEEGRCKQGTKQCAGESLEYFKVCVPESWKDCPVTELHIGAVNPNKTMYDQSLSMGKRSLFFSRSTDRRPFARFDMRENEPCVNPDEVFKSEGRSFFKLYPALRNSCRIDSGFEKMDAIPERLLMENNGIAYMTVFNYSVDTSSPFNWYRLAKRTASWRPLCYRDFVRLGSMKQDMEQVYSDSFPWAVGFFAAIGFTLIVQFDMIKKTNSNQDHSEELRRVRMSVVMMQIVVAGVAAVLMIKLNKIGKLTSSIVDNRCSEDPSVLSFFQESNTSFKNSYNLYFFAAFGLLGCSSIYDVCILLMEKVEPTIVKEEDASESSLSQPIM